MKKVLLEISQNSQEDTCAKVFIKKETLAQVFFYEFCEITKNTFFTEHLRTTAPGNREKVKGIKILCNSEFFLLTFMFDKVFKNGPSKICKRQPL